MKSTKKIYELGVVLPESDMTLAYTFYKRSFITSHEAFKHKKCMTSDDTILTFSKDQIEMDLHFGTHIDALCHCQEHDGNHRKGSLLSGEAIPLLFEKALILDIAGFLGVPFLEPHVTIDVELIASVCRFHQKKVGRDGKIVLIRTGHMVHRLNGDYQRYYHASAGINDAVACFFKDCGVIAVGADNFAIEKVPSLEGDFYPVHRTLLVKHGIFLIENLNLEAICADNRTRCTLIAAPIRIFKSTAAMVNPLAVCEDSEGYF